MCFDYVRVCPVPALRCRYVRQGSAGTCGTVVRCWLTLRFGFFRCGLWFWQYLGLCLWLWLRFLESASDAPLSVNVRVHRESLAYFGCCEFVTPITFANVPQNLPFAYFFQQCNFSNR